MRVVWTDESDAILCRGLEAGLSLRTIAAGLGVTRSMVAGRKYRLGLCEKRRPGEAGHPYSDKEAARLRVMRRAGKSQSEMSKELCRTRGSVAGKLFSLGMTRSNKGLAA